MFKFIKLYLLTLVAYSISGCIPDEKIDVNLPYGEKAIMVEAYLTPDHPYQLLLTENNLLTEELIPRLVKNAQINISTEQGTINLPPLNDTYSSERYYYNYQSEELMHQTNNTIKLTIETPDGQTLSAYTETVRPITIRSASIKSWGVNILSDGYTEPKERYYALSVVFMRTDGSLITKTHKHFFDYSETDNKMLSFTILEENSARYDSARVELMHITKEFYEFNRTIEQAYSANVDNFTVPTPIEGNIYGGLGLFTYFTSDTIMLYKDVQ